MLISEDLGVKSKLGAENIESNDEGDSMNGEIGK